MRIMQQQILVTGGNSGIGLEMVRAFINQGHEVMIAARDLGKSLGVIQALKRETPNARLHAVALDLADFASIDKAAREILNTLTQLDTVMLNAGSFTRGLRSQANGLESMMGSMHFGHFRLMQHLLPQLKVATEARVVMTASVAHWTGRIDEAAFTDYSRYGSDIVAYGSAKLANLIYARELARRVEGSAIRVNAFHPGGVATGIWREMPGPIQRIVDKVLITPAKGADTAIWLATSEAAKHHHGGYFTRRKADFSKPSSRNKALAASLWAASERIAGI
jgi:NAD(P)-dependent dehydrogenase (short-subunit alcohol dehydrogenase family)